MKNADETCEFRASFPPSPTRSLLASSIPPPFSHALSLLPRLVHEPLGRGGRLEGCRGKGTGVEDEEEGGGGGEGNLRGKVKVSREKRKLSLMAVFLGRNT
jgi:hypothetical protein